MFRSAALPLHRKYLRSPWYRPRPCQPVLQAALGQGDGEERQDVEQAEGQPP